MRWVVLALGLGFIGTNAWWVYTSVDHGVTDTYREQICTENQQALAQSLATIRLVKGHLTRQKILEASRSALPQFDEPFEKDGELNVGRLTFKLDHTGKLVDVQAP